jgi:hypothetical protein
MARELGHDPAWEDQQVEAFEQVARLHLLKNSAPDL